MRILVLAARDDQNPLSAGGDQHTTLLARQLAAAGHTVTLVTSKPASLPVRETSGALEILRIAPHRLLAPVVWARLLVGLGRRYDLIVEDLVTGERLPFFARVLGGRPTVGFWFQDNRPLFQIAYGPIGASLAGMLQSALLWLYRTGDLIVPSEGTKDWLVTQGLAATQIQVYHRTTPPPSAAKPDLPFAARENRFVVVANFRAYKRMEEAIDVLSLLRRDVPTAQLTLLGRPDEPAYLARLQRKSREMQLADVVAFEVGVSDERKFELLSRSKALTVHSPIEGLAWSIVEAGLSGVPVVVSRGVPADTVRPGESGLIVPEGGAPAFAEILRDWMRDAATWNRFSEGNRRLATQFVGTTLPAEVDAFLGSAAGPGSG